MRMLILLMLEHPVLTGMLLLLCFLIMSPTLLGAVLIRERQVGIVIKKFGARSLPPGRLIALAGEPGYQADTLAPGLPLRPKPAGSSSATAWAPCGNIASAHSCSTAMIPPRSSAACASR